MKNIYLTKGQVALVDDEMFEIINKYKWCAREGRNTFYSYKTFTISPKRKTILAMHHVIIGYPIKKMVVDHINGNGLDNRRENLRIISYRENSSSFRKDKRIKSSRYIGVSYRPKQTKRPWNSCIKINGINYRLGCFETEEKARQAYQSKIKEISNVK